VKVIIEVYTCPKCKNDFPDISNSAPPKNGELCVSCFIEEELDKLDLVVSRKCKCGRWYPNLPMYFNEEGLCLICSQE